MHSGLAAPRSIAASRSMGSERKVRRHSSAVRRAWRFCLFLALPALIFAGIFLYQGQLSFAPAILLIACLLLYLLLVAAALIEGMVRPLQTLSNVVASLREGDYSFRARGAGSQDALGELATEINALADLLQKQRVRSLEATALLARILEVMHTPLFAFDRHNRLQLASNSGVSCWAGPWLAATTRARANSACKSCWPRPIRPFTPSAQSLRAGCCAKQPSARTARPTRCFFWPM
jgi:HAMP domain-containing protein